MQMRQLKWRMSSYWKYQFLGWGVASIYWAYKAYFEQHYSPVATVANFILDVFIGVLLTHLYKGIFIKNKSKLLGKHTIGQLIVSILSLAFLFMLLNNLKWYFFWGVIKNNSIDLISSLFFWDPPLITGLRLMTIWVLGYHFYRYYKEQIKVVEQNAKLSLLTKQAQLDNLFSQLNPHFLFNSLNSVKSLISEDPIKARRSIDLLSDLLRSSIYTREHLTTIADELQLVKDYIELEKNRFEDRLQLEATIDKNLMEYKIPSLSIQTLVENAVKHGIHKTVKGGVITLSILKIKGFIKIIIKNSGELSSKGHLNNGLGLKNLIKALDIQYNKKASLQLIESPKGVVVATLCIPLQTEDI